MRKVDIGQEKILEILPHRPPFLFVDRVVELAEDERIVAERMLRAEEPQFAGHFPGEPIMPGVLITEAAAQTSGLLYAFSCEARGEDARGRLFYLARADMKWTSPCRPGDMLRIESVLQRAMGGLLSFKVRVFTKRADVAKGNLTLAAAPAK